MNSVFPLLVVFLTEACQDSYFVSPARKLKCRNTTYEETLEEWVKNFEPKNYGPKDNQKRVHPHWYLGYPGWIDKWPLHYNAMTGNLEGVRFYILEKNRDPNEKMVDWFDSEPAGWAANYGQLRVLVELINLGADPRTPNLAGTTPFDNAMAKGHISTVNFLYQYECRRRAMK